MVVVLAGDEPGTGGTRRVLFSAKLIFPGSET